MKKNCAFTKMGAGLMVAALLVLSGCASKTPAPVVDRGQATTGAAQAGAAGRDTYTVKPGDTLLSIAREQGMDVRELAAMNNIDNPNRISVGRVLRVRPQGAAASSAPSGVAVVAPVTTEAVVARPIDGVPAPQTASVPVNGDIKREPKGGKVVYSEQALAAAQGGASTKVPETVVATPGASDPAAAVKPEPAASSDEIAWGWPATGKVIGTFSEAGNKGVDIAGRAGDPVLAAGDGKVIHRGSGLRGYGELVIIKHNATYLSAYAHNQRILVEEGQSVTKGQKIAEMGSTDADRVKLHFEIRRQGKPVDPLKHLPQR